MPMSDCCEKFISGNNAATQALELMRSRYMAYTLAQDEYLLATWHPDTRPLSLSFDPAQRWLGLKIKSWDAGGISDVEGTVEFVARYKVAGKAYRLHEHSRFIRSEGLWYYYDGDIGSDMK